MAIASAALLISAQHAHAGLGDCGQPVTGGVKMVATDCLHILQVAVGSRQCGGTLLTTGPRGLPTDCTCAPKGSLPATATDARICLDAAVGNPVALMCPCGGGGTRFGGFIDSIDIPFVDINQDFVMADCCKDFGPISKDFIERDVVAIDNQLAGLVALMNAFGATDISDRVNAEIAAGEIVLLLDHRDLDAAAAPDPFDLAFLHGRFAPGTDFTQALAGNGQFIPDADNFLPGTSTPKNLFSSATFSSNSVSAVGGTFTAVIPFGGTTLDVAIHEAEISAAHSGVSATGLGYESATVSGYVFPDELVIGINGFLRSDSCACLGLTADVYTEDSEGVWSATGCLADAEALCPLATKRSCIVLAEAVDFDDENAIGFCEFIPDAMFLFADLDLDNDTATFEALSAGIRFTTVPGMISDVVLP